MPDSLNPALGFHWNTTSCNAHTVQCVGCYRALGTQQYHGLVVVPTPTPTLSPLPHRFSRSMGKIGATPSQRSACPKSERRGRVFGHRFVCCRVSPPAPISSSSPCTISSPFLYPFSSQAAIPRGCKWLRGTALSLDRPQGGNSGTLMVELNSVQPSGSLKVCLAARRQGPPTIVACWVVGWPSGRCARTGGSWSS